MHCLSPVRSLHLVNDLLFFPLFSRSLPLPLDLRFLDCNPTKLLGLSRFHRDREFVHLLLLIDVALLQFMRLIDKLGQQNFGLVRDPEVLPQLQTL